MRFIILAIIGGLIGGYLMRREIAGMILEEKRRKEKGMTSGELVDKLYPNGRRVTEREMEKILLEYERQQENR